MLRTSLWRRSPLAQNTFQGSRLIQPCVATSFRSDLSLRYKSSISKRERLWRRDYKEKLVQFEEEKKHGIQWVLNGSVVCERYPMVSPDMEDWEHEFNEWRMEKFNEVALDPNRDIEEVKVDDGVSKRQKKRKQNKAKKDAKAKGEAVVAKGSKQEEKQDFLNKQAAEDQEKAEKEELAEVEEFQEKMEEVLADTLPRVTVDDRANNRKSLNRALPQRLFLLVHNRSTGKWQFPSGAWQEGQTLRECAESEFKKVVGESVDAWVIGNAPSGHTKVRYEEARNGCTGEKTFYFRAQYLGGDLNLDDGQVQDYVWATKGELPEYLEEATLSALDPMLLHQ